MDKHRVQLIQRVKNVGPILNGLLSRNVISRKSYEEIMSIPHYERMGALFSGPLESSGIQGKEIVYNLLTTLEPYLINYLKRMKDKNVMDTVSKSLFVYTL